jgi:hypothetical protein
MAADASQNAVLEVLLRRHLALVGLDELRTMLPAVDSVDFAVKALSADGLVSRLGDRIGASRAAVRFDELRRA